MRRALEPISTKRPAKKAARPKGLRVGYVRVSAVDQITRRQLDGADLDKTFTETASGRDLARPQLRLLLEFIREGDTLVCHPMDLVCPA